MLIIGIIIIIIIIAIIIITIIIVITITTTTIVIIMITIITIIAIIIITIIIISIITIIIIAFAVAGYGARRGSNWIIIVMVTCPTTPFGSSIAWALPSTLVLHWMRPVVSRSGLSAVAGHRVVRLVVAWCVAAGWRCLPGCLVAVLAFAGLRSHSSSRG